MHQDAGYLKQRRQLLPEQGVPPTEQDQASRLRDSGLGSQAKGSRIVPHRSRKQNDFRPLTREVRDTGANDVLRPAARTTQSAVPDPPVAPGVGRQYQR